MKKLFTALAAVFTLALPTFAQTSQNKNSKVLVAEFIKDAVCEGLAVHGADAPSSKSAVEAWAKRNL